MTPACLTAQRWVLIREKWVKSAVSPITGILEANCDPKMLQWSFPKPQGYWEGYPHSQGLTSLPIPFRYSNSCQLFQGVFPTPSTTSLQKKIYKDKLSHSWKILATPHCWGKKILNKIPAPPKSSPQPRIHRDLSCSHPTGTAFVSLVWRSLKPRTLSQDCLQEMII